MIGKNFLFLLLIEYMVLAGWYVILLVCINNSLISVVKLQKKLVVVLSTTLYADSPVLLTIALPI
jgi:hypothetical protein